MKKGPQIVYALLLIGDSLPVGSLIFLYIKPNSLTLESGAIMFGLVPQYNTVWITVSHGDGKRGGVQWAE